MEYNSFYGGRRGASFVIVKRYKTIKDMTKDFSKGANFTQVNFDEYVIIDALKKNDLDNGKIFRRGYDFDSDRLIYYNTEGEGQNLPEGVDHRTYQTEAYGAEYIGTISGPAGQSPVLKMTDLGHIYKMHDENGIASVIESVYLRLTNIYEQFAGIKTGTALEEYNNEIADLQHEKQDLINKTPDSEQKNQAIRKIELVQNYYRSLIETLQASIPELERQINATKEQLETYVHLEEDKTTPFWNPLTQNWQWFYSYDQTLNVIKYKPIKNNQGQYDLQPGDWDTFNDSALGYQDGEYNVNPYVDLVPGKGFKRDPKTGDIIQDEHGNPIIEYNDVIQYASISIEGQKREDEDLSGRMVAWIGFKFPYLVNEYTTTSVTQYDNSGNYNADTSKIQLLYTEEQDGQQIDISNHPFYKKWKISVPKGIKGDSVTELTIKNNPTANNKKWLFRTITDYDEKDEAHGGDPHEEALASWDSINSMSVSADGIIQITFTGSLADKTQYLNFPKAISISENGEISYIMTGDSSSHRSYLVDGGQLDFIKDITLSDDGTLVFDHTKNADVSKNKYLKKINSVTQNKDGNNQPKQGYYTINYNTGDTDPIILSYIDKFEIINGVVYYHKTTGETGQVDGVDITNAQTFDHFSLHNDGSIYVVWIKYDPETGESYEVEDDEPIGQLKYPTKLQILSDGKIKTTYTTSETSTTSNSVVVYPINIEIISDGTANNGKIKTTYNDGTSNITAQAKVIYPTKVEIITDGTTNEGKIKTTYNTGTEQITTDPKIIYPKVISYTPNTGVVTYTNNIGGTPSTMGVLEYVTNINDVEDSINYRYKVQSKTNITTNAPVDIYNLEKNVNEMRITSDFHLVAKYNNLKQTNWNPNTKQYDWDDHYNLDRYLGPDDRYNDHTWVDLGATGLKTHAYDVCAIKETSVALPTHLKQGGIAFLIENISTDPWDYDAPEYTQIEENTPEIGTININNWDPLHPTFPDYMKPGAILLIYESMQ